MSDSESTPEIDVPALQARFAALSEMHLQDQSEIMDLRAALKMRDAMDRSLQASLQQLVEERDALQAQLDRDGEAVEEKSEG